MPALELIGATEGPSINKEYGQSLNEMIRPLGCASMSACLAMVTERCALEDFAVA